MTNRDYPEVTWVSGQERGINMDTIRWGIIGCGDVVETKNGPALYLADHSELAGI